MKTSVLFACGSSLFDETCQVLHVSGHFGEIAFQYPGGNVPPFSGQSRPSLLIPLNHFGISGMAYNFPLFCSFLSSPDASFVESCEELEPGGPYGPTCLARVRHHAGEKRGSSLLQECRVDGARRPCEDEWIVSTSFCAYAVVSCSNLLFDSLESLDDVGDLGFCRGTLVVSSGLAVRALSSSCHTLCSLRSLRYEGLCPYAPVSRYPM